MNVKAVIKKMSSTFTAVVLMAALCLTMAVPAYARNYKLEDKGINYRDYLSFVIAGNEYTMSQLTGEGVDLSGLDQSTPVYAKVDIDGLNTAMKAAGSEAVYVLDTKQTYLSRHIQSSLTVVYRFQDNGDGTYAMVSENDGEGMTVGNLAYVSTVGLYIRNEASSSSAYYGMDALVDNLFKINVIGTFPVKAAVTYVDAEGNTLWETEYVSEEQGYWGADATVEYSDLPEMGNSFELAGTTERAQVYFGYEGLKLKVTVNKLEPNFDGLLAVLEKVENLEEKEYTEESMQALLDAVEAADAAAQKGSDAYQFEVDAAEAAVQAAIDGLQEISVTVDKTELKDALDKYAGYDSRDYTETSWAKYQEAYDAAMKVYHDENASREQVKNALSALNAAEKALVKAEAPEKTPGSSSATDKNTGKTTGAPVTGDNSYAQVYAAAAVLALVAAAGVIVKRRAFH